MESIDLPLPVPLALAKVALVIAFISHIVFVNLMLGGCLIALHTHFLARRRSHLLPFVQQLIAAVTVHKSIAVVLGVGPLLLISIAYTTPFYTSSILIASAWLAVIALVTVAFLMLYIYHFGWISLRIRHPGWHAGAGVCATVLLLMVPLIYLTNTNLMLTPAVWKQQPGFFWSLLHVGNVLPRYAHFLLASLAITGFWISLWWGRTQSDLAPEARAMVVRLGIRWALFPSVAQFVAGPVVLFTLPGGALSPLAIALLAIGIICSLGAIFLLIDSLRGTMRVKSAALLIGVTIVCMASSRHLIRESLLNKATRSLSGADASTTIPGMRS